ncbi:MAG: nicotinate-nucleotide--dimethylbenzimidazole phosphoribosyltransferase [Kordiimonadaceae bacterium]|jgi:nicotinate-nucleotide--dimethylbenzimidazole phosphoribosyltransferase|nr:nicotinate-nucleotide--dimethylbenzimidazole phosphoribosyltransferase [Kordiimonadaceae bacterium]MBT6033168.1 nicotinate-nucleotide--dimethylbenzimidazole phosphoribosyltransferase [Kordiimonadaceae bacterium]
MSRLQINHASDLSSALKNLSEFDQDYSNKAADRQAQLTKPQGSLGRLEDIAIWCAGWQQKEKPSADLPSCLVFAGNHGVAVQGVSAFPPEVTAQMVGNFQNGGAAINQLTKLSGASLDVIALELDKPTNDFTIASAMSEKECCVAIQAGADAVPENADILLLGEMGIANTTSAAAVALSTFGGDAKDWVGHGTGIDDAGLILKQQVVDKAVNLHKGSQTSSFDILMTVGGRELAAIAGAVIEARLRRIPVLLDGFISTSAAAALTKDNPHALEHTLISHSSVERGHQKLALKLNMRPILDLDMRLGEASGAAVALMIIKAALATHNDMATFDQAGVSNND